MGYFQFHGESQVDPLTQTTRRVDEMLRDYFPNFDNRGVFFDVGAFEPILISNSYHFERNGWLCYLFEANPDGIPKLKKHRQHVFNYAVSDEDSDEVVFNLVSLHDTTWTKDLGAADDQNWTASYSAIDISDEYKQIFGWDERNEVKQIRVPGRTLDTVIQEEIPGLDAIDILSVDIEGGELRCLRGLDLHRYQPTVILVENATPADPTLENYLRGFGYSLDRQASYNQFYTAR